MSHPSIHIQQQTVAQPVLSGENPAIDAECLTSSPAFHVKHVLQQIPSEMLKKSSSPKGQDAIFAEAGILYDVLKKEKHYLLNLLKNEIEIGKTVSKAIFHQLQQNGKKQFHLNEGLSLGGLSIQKTLRKLAKESAKTSKLIKHASKAEHSKNRNSQQIILKPKDRPPSHHGLTVRQELYTEDNQQVACFNQK